MEASNDQVEAQASEIMSVEPESQIPSPMSASTISHGSDTNLSVDDYKTFGPGSGDINTAAALRAQYAIDTPKPTRRRRTKKPAVAPPPPTHTEKDDEKDVVPLIDNTASLPLHSKKTERLLRKAQKKSLQAANIPTLQSLPSELLLEVLSYLPPRTIFHLIRTSHQFRALILANEASLCHSIIRLRYETLFRSFPLPIPFATLSPLDTPALLNPKRLEMLNIHRRSYHHHVPSLSPTEICTCMTCVFAWNNLNLILDLHHWQTHLDNRDPIPMIPRGTNPEWNTTLLARHAATVRAALTSPLVYARILEKHLDSITRTIQRNSSARWKPKPKPTHSHSHNKLNPHAAAAVAAAAATDPHSSNPSTSTSTTSLTPLPSSSSSSSSSTVPLPSSLTSKPLLYHLTPTDISAETDTFLSRSGPPSYDFPYHRDIYYSIEAYVPNRKWSSETKRWHYYAEPPVQHERDLEWVRSWGRRIEGLKEGILNVRVARAGVGDVDGQTTGAGEGG